MPKLNKTQKQEFEDITNKLESDMIEILADIKYISYKFNRNHCPTITPEYWKKAFGEKVDDFEKIYQAEKAYERTEK